nr:hypothetical protein [Tanacetum cinerariifolium]
MIIIENLPPPNDNQNAPEEEPFMDQAPAAFDGFAPHWLGEQFPNINNGWIEWDVPLRGEMDEPMVDPEVNEEVIGGDDWDVEVEWLMAPVTPPRATMMVSSTYEDLGHRVVTRKMEEVSDVVMADSIAIREIHPRVATVGEQVESRVDTQSSGQMAVQGHDVIVGSNEQVQTLQTALHETESQNQQLWTRVAELESYMGIVMPYMMWMEERLTALEKRPPGPPPGPQ